MILHGQFSKFLTTGNNFDLGLPGSIKNGNYSGLTLLTLARSCQCKSENYSGFFLRAREFYPFSLTDYRKSFCLCLG